MKTTITIGARISIPVDGLPTDLLEALRATCTHVNPEYARSRAMGRFYANVPKHILMWKEERGAITLPSGAMKRVRQIFSSRGVPFRLVDARTQGDMISSRRPLKYVGHELRPYQIEMNEKAFARERCVVRASTGSGKTTAAFALAAKIALNTLVILPNAKLLGQWLKRAKHDLGLQPKQVGIIRAGKRVLRPLTLATQQTLNSRGIDDELQTFFGAVLVDEAHHCAASTFVKTIDQFPARYRIAFTADERRKDKKEFIIYDLIGEVAAEVDRDACERVGAIVDVDIRVVMTDFGFPQYQRDRDFNKLLAAMTEDKARNKIALDIASREVAAGEQVIVLTHRREHARDTDRELLARGISSGCLLGSQDPGDEAEFEEMCAKLISGKARAGVGTYQALGEGIDLPAVSVGIAMTPIATNRQLFNQVRGRLCRTSAATNKTHGRLYVLFDPQVFDERILRNIISWNRTVHVLSGSTWIAGNDYLKKSRY